MKEMFDALVPPQPDPAYFDRRDFGEDARRRLRDAEAPFGCILRGPAAWDPARQPSYPLYSACKSNTEDNPDFVPYRYGTVVVTSETTGEILLRLMREDEGKTPLPNPRPARPERPGLARAKTYSVNDHWRTLVPEDFRGGHGAYRAFLHAGDFQSEPFRFEVARRDGQPAASPFESLLVAESPGPAPYGIPGASFDPDPGFNLPDAPGAFLATGRPAPGPDGAVSFPVQGAFRFAGAWEPHWRRLPLHVLVAVRGERELDLATLWIPRDRCAFEGGGYSGNFRFDLADLFRGPDGIPKVPGEAWISLVHRGWRGPIGKHRLSPAP